MANHNSITTTRQQLARRDFGNYIAGFVDGEGCFILTTRKNSRKTKEHGCGSACFQIQIRLDDLPILKAIEKTWGCGSIMTRMNRSRYSAKVQPSALFLVRKIGDLHNTVIPFFDEFQLRAKKKRDYLIWKRAVKFLYEIKTRTRNHSGNKWVPKWKPGEYYKFLRMEVALKKIRRYRDLKQAAYQTAVASLKA